MHVLLVFQDRLSMLDIQRSKFSWPFLREKLLAIEDAQLVHGNACHDNFWGVCLCQSLPVSKQKYGVSLYS